MRLITLLVEQFLAEDTFDMQKFLSRLRGVMELVRRGAGEGERGAAKFAMERLKERAKEEIAKMREERTVSGATIDNFIREMDRILADTKAEEPKAKPQQERPKQEPPRRTPPLYKENQWVRATVVAQGSKDGETRETGKVIVGKIKTVRFYDGKNYYDIAADNTVYSVAEANLRRATQEEVDAALARSRARGDRTQDTMEIMDFAHYFEPAENSNKVYGTVKYKGKIYTFWGGVFKALATKQFGSYDEAFKQFSSKVRKGYMEMDFDGEAPKQMRAWVHEALKVRFAKLGE